MEALGTSSDPVVGAIIDIDNHEVEGIALIEEIKGNSRLSGIAIIVHTVQSSKEAVAKMIEIGVAGYLLKPFDPDAAHAKISVILGKLASHNSQRKHIRVKLEADDMAKVHFRMPGSSQLVSGRIIDISLGGLAAELFNPPAVELISPGSPIPKIEFAIAGKELSPSASIVMLKANVLAIKFETLSLSDKKVLERFIFNRISS